MGKASEGAAATAEAQVVCFGEVEDATGEVEDAKGTCCFGARLTGGGQAMATVMRAQAPPRAAGAIACVAEEAG